VAAMNEATVTRFLKGGYAVATWTNPYDGVSAVDVDPDGMVRSALPVDDHGFGMALEVGGRAMNLLFPYVPGQLCAHGLVKRTPGDYWSGVCDCGIEPIGPNPARNTEA
jgi:hypothetical protein